MSLFIFLPFNFMNARSRGRAICGRSLAGVVGSNPVGSMDVYLFVSVVCWEVEVSVTS